MISYNLKKVEVIKEEKTANATAGPSIVNLPGSGLKAASKENA